MGTKACQALSCSMFRRVLVDCRDALTTDRPYRRSIPQDKAVELILGGKGDLWDPGAVEAFVAVLDHRRRHGL